MAMWVIEKKFWRMWYKFEQYKAKRKIHLNVTTVSDKIVYLENIDTKHGWASSILIYSKQNKLKT